MSLKSRKFDVEVGKVLNLVVNSIYTNKDIFLRELISNASDACDKLRYETIKNPSLTKREHLYEILLRIDRQSKTIRITDSGIGMNENDLSKCLGTIANSGTQRFFKTAIK